MIIYGENEDYKVNNKQQFWDKLKSDIEGAKDVSYRFLLAEENLKIKYTIKRYFRNER